MVSVVQHRRRIMSNVTSMQSEATRQRRSALKRRLHELAKLGWHREELEIEYAADPLDQVRNGVERDIAVSQLDRQARSVREVELALAKLEEGSYGVCEQCEEEISDKRLDAVPWARLCVACQSKAEASPHEPEMVRFHEAA
jgi:DnaK suppressor protein